MYYIRPQNASIATILKNYKTSNTIIMITVASVAIVSKITNLMVNLLRL